MKLQQLQVKVVEAASAATLETAIAAFIADANEATFLSIQYQVAGAGPTFTYTALISYTA